MDVRKQWKLYATLLLLLLALLAGQRGQQVDAQDPSPDVEEFAQKPPRAAPLANVGSGFTYQGYLQDDGDPAEGVYDLQFSLYDTDSGGSPLDNTTAEDITVTNGRFTVPLAFSGAVFDGTELWLEVAVRPGSGTGSFTSLAPRQLVQPAPYANTLRPGAAIAASYGDTLLTVDNNDNRGLYVEAGDDGIQVTAGSPDFFGYALGAGTGIEVNAENNGVFVGRANNYGVWVNHTGNHGIRVSNAGGSGVRVENADAYGVYAEASYDDIQPNASGVYGERSGTDTGYGGEFVHSGSGIALHAESNGTIEPIMEAWNPGDREWYVSSTGHVYADANFNAGGADVAEMLPAVEGLEAGDVLIIGPDGLLARSTTEYETSVIGVYSSQPGFVGGNGEGADPTGKVPVGILGIVPARASAENGSVAPGDLLTTSSTPGHVMKVEPTMVDGVPIYPTGAIVGKAMEPLESGTGLIKVFVMPQ